LPMLGGPAEWPDTLSGRPLASHDHDAQRA